MRLCWLFQYGLGIGLFPSDGAVSCGGCRVFLKVSDVDAVVVVLDNDYVPVEVSLGRKGGPTHQVDDFPLPRQAQ